VTTMSLARKKAEQTVYQMRGRGGDIGSVTNSDTWLIIFQKNRK